MFTLQIENYKCFKESQPVAINDLTVLAGQNSVGKSSIIQSLLLLHLGVQLKDVGQMYVNNPELSLELGTASELPNMDSGSEKFTIGLYDDDSGASNVVEFEVPDDEDLWSSLIIKALYLEGETEEGIEALSRQEFYYLASERLGPRISTTMGNLLFRNTGCRGEFSAQVLGEREGRIKVEKLRLYPGTTNPNLEAQVNYWLNSIIPGTTVTTINNRSSLQQQIVMRRGNTNVKATNVGFGISYILPVIITCLIGRKGSFVLIDTPEAHLHPTAQTALGEFIARMSMTGLRIVVETHSEHVIDGMKLYASEFKENRGRISINFLSSTEDGVLVVKTINFTEDFKYDAYPRGFMDQSVRDFHRQREILQNQVL